MTESIDGLKIRLTKQEDAKVMRPWFDDKEILRWFPMLEDKEIDDSVMRWVSFARYDCSLTAEYEGEVCGISTLYLQPYKKLMHQCEFGIIVGPSFRGKGIGSLLLNSLMYMAKTKFNIEILHLQVYGGNPAMRLYKRFGFKEFGRQEGWIKEEGEFLSRVFMERYL